jgi:hypothetical protein
VTVDEARLWADLIRPTFRESVIAPDAWTGILYAILAERGIGVLRLSELTLRLPAMLAGMACGWAVWRRQSAFVAATYGAAAALGWFSTAAGQGIATALCLTIPRPSGWRIGLAIAFSPAFALILLIYWRIREIERITIPAVVTAFFLLLIPATHAGPTPTADRRPEFFQEANRRNTARGGGFQPPAVTHK